jgi:hypothetical protein
LFEKVDKKDLEIRYNLSVQISLCQGKIALSLAFLAGDDVRHKEF